MQKAIACNPDTKSCLVYLHAQGGSCENTTVVVAPGSARVIELTAPELSVFEVGVERQEIGAVTAVSGLLYGPRRIQAESTLKFTRSALELSACSHMHVGCAAVTGVAAHGVPSSLL